MQPGQARDRCREREQRHRPGDHAKPAGRVEKMRERQPSCISLVWVAVPRVSTSPPYLFGDLLALARQSWVRQMASRLDQRGYSGYRRSDAAVMRFLTRDAAPIGQLGSVLGVSRQAARKIADGLVQRRYAATNPTSTMPARPTSC